VSSTVTIGQSYWEGTRDHDVSQNIAALLKHIPGPPPFDLLDFGCGPGRDLRTFKALEQSFLHLELPALRYDGVFANAVLFHVPSQVLPQVLRQLQACLRPLASTSWNISTAWRACR
jgi:hypothetical protein